MPKRATMNHSTNKPKKLHEKKQIAFLNREVRRYAERLDIAEARTVMWKNNFLVLSAAFAGTVVSYILGYIPNA